MKTYYSILALLVFSMMGTACDKKMTFSPADAIDGLYIGEDDGDGGGGDGGDPGEDDGTNPNNPPPTCTVTYTEITTPVKVLFLIDKTGSNADDSNTPAPNDGTDSTKAWRLSAINDLRNHLSLDIFSFNMTLFRGNHTNINDGHRYGGAGGEVTKSLINGFSNDPSVIDAAVNEFAADPDKGKTPYQAALAKARDIIAEDIQYDTVSQYSVVMVTDGFPDPNLVTRPGGNPNNGADADIDASIDMARGFVSEIVDINPARVNVNTVYYYGQGRRHSYAANILTGMADEGKGAFIEASSNNTTIDFKNVIRVPLNSCP